MNNEITPRWQEGVLTHLSLHILPCHPPFQCCAPLLGLFWEYSASIQGLSCLQSCCWQRLPEQSDLNTELTLEGARPSPAPPCAPVAGESGNEILWCTHSPSSRKESRILIFLFTCLNLFDLRLPNSSFIQLGCAFPGMKNTKLFPNFQKKLQRRAEINVQMPFCDLL